MIKHERTADVDLRLRRVSGAARCIAAIAVPITSIAVLAATVCMAPRIALAQITLSGSNGYTLSWNGNQFWSGTVPTNLASASGTANAFGSGQLTPTGHAIVNINDGLYGNGESWINGAEAAPYYIGIRFPQAADLSSIAWSRANTSPVTNSDRSVGSYTIQFTTVASPGTSTASGDWTTIGTVTLGAATGDYAPYQRHEYTLADSSGGPITGVTGIRILTFSGACIDEISTFRQVYRTTGSGDLYAANSFSTAVTGGTTTTPYVGDILAFSATTSATQAITLGGTSQNARAMRFSTSDAVTFTAGGTNGTLSLGYLADIATGVTNLGVGNRTTSGGTTLTLDAGAGAVTIGSATAGQQVAIALNASNTWVNNSANTLTVNNGVSRFSTDGTSRMLTVSGSGATAIAGVIANGGTDGTLALTKSGAGTLTLSASNSYTGLTTVTAGTLALGDAGSLLATGSVALAGSGATFDLSAASGDRTIGMLTGTAGSVVALGARTLTVGDATSGTFAGGIGGTGGLTKVGGGLLALTGSSSYSGTTSITAGTLQIGHANAFGTGTISFGGGTLRYGSGITTDVSGRVSTAAGQAYNVDTNGNTVTWATALASSGGTLTKSGAGTLVLSASNSYTGPTVASAGVLQFATKAALYGGETASWVPDTINVKSGATLALDVGGTGEFDSTDVATLLVNLASSTSASSGLNAGAALGFDTANAAGGVFTLSTAVADTTGAAGGAIGLVKLGSGAITLSVANSYSGGTTLSAGQLNIDNASALGTGTFTIAGSGTIDNTSGGAITLSTNNPQAWNTDVTFVGSNPLDVGTGTVTLSANRLVTVTSSTLTVGGGIRGAFSLTKAGAGALVLSGSNARSGGTTLNAGRLSIDNAAALGTGTFTIAGSGTIDNTSGAAVTLSTNNPQAWNADFTFAGTNPLNLGTGAVSFSATRSVTVTSSTLTAGGSFGGSAALTKAGAGTLALTGISTHSGTINLNAGTLQLGNIGTAGRSNVVVAAGAALELTGSAASIGTLSGTTAASIALGNATLTINQATDRYYYGTISGSGGLTLSGTQPLRLMTPNTYAGPTAANGSNSLFSVLVLQGTANLLPSTTVVTLSNVAQVDLYGFTQTWAGLAGTAGNIYSFGETGAPLVLGVASDMTYAYAGRLGTATGGRTVWDSPW